VHKQLTLSGIRLQDTATFDNFYAVGNNLGVYSFLQSFFLTEEIYVYLWGNLGAGCSHLLQACCHMADAMGKNVMYIPLAEYDAFTPEIFDNLETMDIVALDDLHKIAKQLIWEEAVFHLFNRLRNEGKKLLIAGNNPPNQLGMLLPDLVSRLSWGTVFRVHALSDAEKIQALQLRAKHRGIKLPEEVANFLLRHYSRSSADLFNALDTLDLASLAEQRKLTIPFVKTVLGL
jgi:DnaA-homolog protein